MVNLINGILNFIFHFRYEYWRDKCFQFLLDIGLEKSNLKIQEHSDKELAHYASASADIEFLYPNGWGELWGIANRGDKYKNSNNKILQKK